MVRAPVLRGYIGIHKDGRGIRADDPAIEYLYNAPAAAFHIVQGCGDHAGARDAFSRARVVFSDRYGKNDARARSAATAAMAAHRHATTLSHGEGGAIST